MLRLMFNRVTIEKRQEAQHCHPYRIKLLRSQVFLKVECMLDPLKEKQGAIGQLRDVGEEGHGKRNQKEEIGKLGTHLRNYHFF